MSYQNVRERALAKIADKRCLAETQAPSSSSKLQTPVKDEMVEFKDVGSAMAWLRTETKKTG